MGCCGRRDRFRCPELQAEAVSDRPSSKVPRRYTLVAAKTCNEIGVGARAASHRTLSPVFAETTGRSICVRTFVIRGRRGAGNVNRPETQSRRGCNKNVATKFDMWHTQGMAKRPPPPREKNDARIAFRTTAKIKAAAEAAAARDRRPLSDWIEGLILAALEGSKK